MNRVDDGTQTRWAASLDGAMGAIDAARHLAEAFCDAHDASPRTRVSLTLVLEELIANCVSHGGVRGRGAINVALRMAGNAVAISHRDRGAAFDPTRQLPPDPRDEPVELRAAGGLGWPLILHYCTVDSWQYVDGENRLHLTLRSASA